MTSEFEWTKWAKEIPYLEFDEEWKVKAVPPFLSGVIQYNIQHRDNSEVWVSVFLDCYDLSGAFGAPYWEVWPFKGFPCQRYEMSDTEGLLNAIRQGINEQMAEVNEDGDNTC